METTKKNAWASEIENNNLKKVNISVTSNGVYNFSEIEKKIDFLNSFFSDFSVKSISENKLKKDKKNAIRSDLRDILDDFFKIALALSEAPKKELLQYFSKNIVPILFSDKTRFCDAKRESTPTVKAFLIEYKKFINK